MQFSIGLRYVTMALVMLAPAAARAQTTSDVAEITGCLCQERAVAALSADMSAKTQALDAIRRQLADLDAQLVHERPLVEVNNPDSVARYKALLEHRDAVYHQSVGAVVTDADQAVARYNAQVNEYNSRCANRPFSSDVVARI